MLGKHDDVAECVRALMFENEGNDEYPYSVHGTGFLLEYRDVLFVVCAKHSMNDRKPTELLIRSRIAQDTFLPIQEMITPSAILEKDQDALDFLYFKVAKEKLGFAEPCWRIESSFSPCLLHAGNTLYFCGYPSDNQDIAYEHQKVSLSLLDGSAVYHGASILENCHQVELVNVYAKCLDGFSGSPVFRVTTLKPDTTSLRWLG